MRSLEKLLAGQRAIPLRYIGIDPAGSTRVFENQMQGLFSTAGLLRLPPVNVPAQQNEDGSLMFMSDASAIDGPDTLG